MKWEEFPLPRREKIKLVLNHVLVNNVILNWFQDLGVQYYFSSEGVMGKSEEGKFPLP